MTTTMTHHPSSKTTKKTRNQILGNSMSVGAVLSVLLLASVTPAAALAPFSQQTDDLYELLGVTPVQDRFAPLVQTVSPYLSEEDQTRLGEVAELLATAESAALEDYSSQALPAASNLDSLRIIPAAVEGCTQGSCGGSYSEENGNTWNYASNGNHEFIASVCSGNAFWINGPHLGETTMGDMCTIEYNNTYVACSECGHDPMNEFNSETLTALAESSWWIVGVRTYPVQAAPQHVR